MDCTATLSDPLGCDEALPISADAQESENVDVDNITRIKEETETHQHTETDDQTMPTEKTSHSLSDVSVILRRLDSSTISNPFIQNDAKKKPPIMTAKTSNDDEQDPLMLEEDSAENPTIEPHATTGSPEFESIEFKAETINVDSPSFQEVNHTDNMDLGKEEEMVMDASNNFDALGQIQVLEVVSCGGGNEFDQDQNWRQGRSHASKLEYLLETPGRYQDVIFIVGEEKVEIQAHSFVLYMNSPVFGKLLEEAEEKQGTKEIVLEDVCPQVFRVILRFMYTEKLQLMGQDVEEVYKVAKMKFQIEELSENCVKVIKDNITLQNCIKVFKLAKEHQEIELQEGALRFILRNGEIILQSSGILELSREDISEILSNDNLDASELLVFKAAVVWAENECYSQDQKSTPEFLRAALGDIIFKIRFPLLSAEEFKVSVVPSNILNVSEVIQLFTYFTPPFGTVGPDFIFSTSPRLQFKNRQEDNDNVTQSTVSGGRGRAPSTSTRASSFSTTGQETTPNEHLKKERQNDVKNEPIRRGRKRKAENIKEKQAKDRKQKSSDSSPAPSTSHSQSSRTSSRTKKPSLKYNKDEIIEINSSSSSSSSDSDWDDTSESSDSSDDPTFQPQPRPLPTGGKRIIQSQPLIKKSFLDLLQKGISSSQDHISKVERVHEITEFIKQVNSLKNRQTLVKLDANLTVLEVPTMRVHLPKISDFCLNLTSPLLNRENPLPFKTVAVPLLGSDIANLIFCDRVETIGKIKNINKCHLFNLWNFGIRVRLTLEGVVAFSCSSVAGELICAYSGFAGKNVLAGSRNSLPSPQMTRNALRSLTLCEIFEPEFDLFHRTPPENIRTLTILKVTSLPGVISNFVRKCTNLKQLDLDAAPSDQLDVLYLDEDLHLFSPNCRLIKLNVSNTIIDLKHPNTVILQGKVPNPNFYFCEFSPSVVEKIRVIFPGIASIKFKGLAKNLSAINEIMQIKSVQRIGVWEAKFFNDSQQKQQLNSSGFFNNILLRETLRLSAARNAKCRPELLNKFGFVLKRLAPSDAGTQQTMANKLSDVVYQWQGVETNRDERTLVWDYKPLLKGIYNDFMYAKICSYQTFEKLFSHYY